ncbi:hypothetical protein D3C84_1053610 [compost metagenome]
MLIKAGITFALNSDTPPKTPGIQRSNLSVVDILGIAFGKMVSRSFLGTRLNIFKTIDPGSTGIFPNFTFFFLR